MRLNFRARVVWANMNARMFHCRWFVCVCRKKNLDGPKKSKVSGARQRAGNFFDQNVRSVRSRFSGCVRGRSQIFLVRSENILVGGLVPSVPGRPQEPLFTHGSLLLVLLVRVHQRGGPTHLLTSIACPAAQGPAPPTRPPAGARTLILPALTARRWRRSSRRRRRSPCR